MTTMIQNLQNTDPKQAEPMPAIVVSDADYNRLVNLAAVVEEREPNVANVLQAEMKRAQVVSADVFPANVVRMGSTVEFRSDAGQQIRVALVYPGDADFAQGKLSILTPIGAALIGLSPGQSIAWTARDGRQHWLTVLKVEQPASSPAAMSPASTRASAQVA